MLERTTARVVEALTAREPVAVRQRCVLKPWYAQMLMDRMPKTAAFMKHSRTSLAPTASSTEAQYTPDCTPSSSEPERLPPHNPMATKRAVCMGKTTKDA